MNRDKACWFAAMLTLWCVASGAAVLRVDSKATGTPMDGSTWPQAYRTLQAGLAAADNGDELWLVAGVYTPGDPGAGRNTTFSIPSGVSVYGGFLPGALTREERDPSANVSILSGDINGNDAENSDTRLDNSYHVITVAGNAEAVILDGMMVQEGRANGDMPDDSGAGVLVQNCTVQLHHCTIRDNLATGAGGGLRGEGATLDLSDVRIESNRAGAGGGFFLYQTSANMNRILCLHNEGGLGGAGYISTSSTVVVVNGVVADNMASADGGGFYNSASSTLNLLNNTFSGNTCGAEGGAITSWHAQMTTENSILWGNLPDQLYDYDEHTCTVSTSIIQGGWPGEGILDVDPRFRLTQVPHPCQLNWDSPAIDSASAAAPATDFGGGARPQNQGFDVGAHEFGTDSDHGGLPDAYENDFDLSVSDPADDVVDSDGDGLDNREEFRRGTSPRDINDPPSRYFVSITGSDDTGEGTQGNPWRTIGFAMASVPEGAAAFPITLHVSAGTFEEKVTLRPYTRLIGAGGAQTILQYYQAGDDEHVVITAAQGAGLQDCTVTFPGPVTATAELLRIENVAMAVSGVVFNGVDSPHAIAVFITGVHSSDSIIRNSVIRRAEYGVFAVDSGVNVTRNTFEDLFEIGIFIRPPDGKQAGDAATPLLGDAAAASQTGFNRFHMSTGVFVKNMTSSTAKAEYNDWGVYTEAAIAGRVVNSPGKVDYQPFLGQALLGAVIAVSVVDETTGERIPDTVNPVVTLSSSAIPRDAASSLFLFTVEAGVYTCSATAEGYSGDSESVQVEAGDTAAITLELHRATSEGEGETEGAQEGEGEKENAILGCHGEQNTMGDKGDWVFIVLAAIILLSSFRRHLNKPRPKTSS